MKHVLRGVIAAVSAITLCIGVSTPAHAFATWYGNRLVYGIGGGGQAYWIASTAGGYAGYIDAAMANWINTSSRIGVRTPLFWSKTTSKSAARMELHGVNRPTDGYCAIVTHYTGSTVIQPWLGAGRNWVWGKADINSALFNGSGCSNRQGIVSHEMGHVFGLAHTSATSPVMYTYISGTGVVWATVDDANGINHLY